MTNEQAVACTETIKNSLDKVGGAILLSTAAILVPVVFVISNPGASIVAGIAIGLAFLGLCRSI